jgi:hypothetical protein
MKSLVESLFDKDLAGKDVFTVGCYFEVSVDRHKENSPSSKEDITVMNELEKEISSLNLKLLNCEELIRTLGNLTKKYTKGWRGGAYSHTVRDRKNYSVKSIKNVDLINDVSRLSLRNEDWTGDYKKLYTYIVLTRR